MPKRCQWAPLARARRGHGDRACGLEEVGLGPVSKGRSATVYITRTAWLASMSKLNCRAYRLGEHSAAAGGRACAHGVDQVCMSVIRLVPSRRKGQPSIDPRWKGNRHPHRRKRCGRDSGLAMSAPAPRAQVVARWSAESGALPASHLSRLGGLESAEVGGSNRSPRPSGAAVFVGSARFSRPGHCDAVAPTASSAAAGRALLAGRQQPSARQQRVTRDRRRVGAPAPQGRLQQGWCGSPKSVPVGSVLVVASPMATRAIPRSSRPEST